LACEAAAVISVIEHLESSRRWEKVISVLRGLDTLSDYVGVRIESLQLRHELKEAHDCQAAELRRHKSKKRKMDEKEEVATKSSKKDETKDSDNEEVATVSADSRCKISARMHSRCKISDACNR
jgi:hypothetical protein